jgi:quinol monooxygenase YgiN
MMPNAGWSPIVDLRQYTLFPGTRDEFVKLFDREFVETQEACGMRIIGQFRDLGDPNRFVWLRGFQDMPARERALNAFYIDGAAWKAHGEAARSMMIDSTDALLLHPSRPGSGFKLDDAGRRPQLDTRVPEGLIVATIYPLAAPVGENLLELFECRIAPALGSAGASILASFATDHSPNNFPRLVLREREDVFVLFCGFKNEDAYHDHMTTLGRAKEWRGEIGPAVMRYLRGRPQVLRLEATSRSQVRM